MLQKPSDSSSPRQLQAFLRRVLQPPQHGCLLSSMGVSSLVQVSPLQHSSCKTSSGDTCAASGAGPRHVSSYKTQVSRTVRLRSLSWLGHPLLQLRHVADAGWSSTSRTPDVPSAEHHQLHCGSGRCLAVFYLPEVADVLTCGVETASGVLPCAWGGHSARL